MTTTILGHMKYVHDKFKGRKKVQPQVAHHRDCCFTKLSNLREHLGIVHENIHV